MLGSLSKINLLCCLFASLDLAARRTTLILAVQRITAISPQLVDSWFTTSKSSLCLNLSMLLKKLHTNKNKYDLLKITLKRLKQFK
jgi:hypothetical protein